MCPWHRPLGLKHLCYKEREENDHNVVGYKQNTSILQRKIEKHIESSDLRLAKLEEIVSSGNMTTVNDTESKEIEKLKT